MQRGVVQDEADRARGGKGRRTAGSGRLGTVGWRAAGSAQGAQRAWVRAAGGARRARQGRRRRGGAGSEPAARGGWAARGVKVGAARGVGFTGGVRGRGRAAARGEDGDRVRLRGFFGPDWLFGLSFFWIIFPECCELCTRGRVPSPRVSKDTQVRFFCFFSHFF
jgi:hypothetical protein